MSDAASDTTILPADPQARLAELRRAKEEREKKRAEEFALQEVELLELEEHLEKEHGARGREFEIVDARDLGEGFIAVKRGEGVLHKRFINSKQTDVDIDHYVTPNVVHPDRDKYRAIVDRRPQLALRVGNALATLYGTKGQEVQGKF